MNQLLSYLIVGWAVFQLSAFHPVAAQIFQKSFEVENREINVKDFNKKIEEVIDKAEIPGLSLAVIDRNEVVFYNTYGYKKYERSAQGELKPRRKVNKRTVFEGCSLSKSFFVLAVHQLVDQGVIDLNTPLYRYLEHPRLKHDERYKKITGNMVLNHSSGIENWQYYNNPDTLEILIEPGASHVYSGEGYMYLARVLEKLLGKSIEEYMEELVYQPLNLKRTFTTFKNDHKPRNYSIGHDSFKAAQPKYKNYTMEDPDIAGRISTTAQDYAKLLIGIFGGEYLSRERLDHLTDNNGTFLTEDPAGNVHRYGPGFVVLIDQAGDTAVYQHGNNTYFKGWGCYNITKDSGFVLFANGIRGDKIRSIIQELLFGIKEDDITEYPNAVFATLDAYNEEGYNAAFNYLSDQIEENSLSEYEFSELSELFLYEHPEFSAYISGEMKNRFPNDQAAYLLHGKSLMENHRYQAALANFEKALTLDEGSNTETEALIVWCREQLEKSVMIEE